MDIAKPSRGPAWRRPRNILMAAGAAFALVLLVLLMRMGQAAPAVAATAVWIGSAERGEVGRGVRGMGVLLPRIIRWIIAGARATAPQLAVVPGAGVQADPEPLGLAGR